MNQDARDKITYDRYIELWCACFLGKGSKRGREIARKQLDAISKMAEGVVMDWKKKG